MVIDIKQFHQAFFEEASEHLASMETLLLSVDIADPDGEQLNAIFRAAHSIKGSSGTFGFTDLTQVTHILENLLDRIRKGELAIQAEMIDAFLDAGDVLKVMLAAHRGEGTVDPAQVAAVCERLTQLTSDLAEAPGPAAALETETETEAASAPETVAPAPAAPAAADDSFGFFVELTPPAPASEPAIAPAMEPAHASEPDAPPATPAPVVTSAAKSAPAPAPAAAAARPTRPDSAESTIRVDVDKVDQLINLVGELVITQAMLAQSALGVDPVAFERLHTGMVQLERNTRDLQETVMSIRMMPMSVVFSRFPRVVRDLSQKLGKKVELKTSGESTELDKSLIERITDPLTHLIRNSLDHGIESPSERALKGKQETGIITLKAYQQSGNIVIEVGDDGAGLNREKILAKAKEKGLAVSDTISDHDVWQLIFDAGFSTAEQITEVSGRGVGMDVVKRNITAMGGRVEISSMAGVGTRMTVKLPLTLAILDGMSVGAGSETYIIPLGYVIESVQVDKSMIKSISGAERLIQIRGEYLPVIALYQQFKIPNTLRDFEQGIMVVLEVDGTKAALFVDTLLGQHQVVIKSLENNYRKVPGIGGATIMGDGHVALILDVTALVSMARDSLAVLEPA